MSSFEEAEASSVPDSKAEQLCKQLFEDHEALGQTAAAGPGSTLSIASFHEIGSG